MNSFFSLLFRQKYITRWGLMRNTHQENIQEHSLQVAMISHSLAVIGNEMFGKDYDAGKAAVYAMYHDCNEIYTGDMPTPVKYHNPEILKAYKSVEEISKERLIGLLPEELRKPYKDILFFESNDEAYKILVKSADRISAYIKCVEELKSGNLEFSDAAVSIRESITSIELDEVKYFMDTFIEGFELTLDKT